MRGVPSKGSGITLLGLKGNTSAILVRYPSKDSADNPKPVQWIVTLTSNGYGEGKTSFQVDTRAVSINTATSAQIQEE
jgi:hypothetical protein